MIGNHSYCAEPIKEFYGDRGTLNIGKYCCIAQECVVFLGGNHRLDWISTYPFSVIWDGFSDIAGHPSTKGDVWIGNDVWIGYGVTILSGVSIWDGAVIGAGSVVTKDIGPYELWAGNPAAYKKSRFPKEDIDFLCSLKWWDWEDGDVRKIVPLLMSNNIAGLREYK